MRSPCLREKVARVETVTRRLTMAMVEMVGTAATPMRRPPGMGHQVNRAMTMSMCRALRMVSRILRASRLYRSIRMDTTVRMR